MGAKKTTERFGGEESLWSLEHRAKAVLGRPCASNSTFHIFKLRSDDVMWTLHPTISLQRIIFLLNTSRKPPGLPFLIDYVLQPLRHMGGVQGRKPEPGTPRLERRNDLAHVVADQAEAGVASVLLNDCSRQKKMFL